MESFSLNVCCDSGMGRIGTVLCLILQQQNNTYALYQEFILRSQRTCNWKCLSANLVADNSQSYCKHNRTISRCAGDIQRSKECRSCRWCCIRLEVKNDCVSLEIPLQGRAKKGGLLYYWHPLWHI